MKIKKTKLKSLVKEIVDTHFVAFMISHGFKHLKSKKIFLKRKNTIDQTVQLSLNPVIAYQLDQDYEIHLITNLSTVISSSDFENWLSENFKEKWRYQNTINIIQFKTKIARTKFEEKDFSITSKGEIFKKGISQLINQQENEFQGFNDFSSGKEYWENSVSNDLELKSNWDYLWDNKPLKDKISIQDCRLLIYLNRLEEAKAGYNDIFKLCEVQKQKNKINPPHKDQLKEFNKYYEKIKGEYNSFIVK